jgi:hypothetical protein
MISRLSLYFGHIYFQLYPLLRDLSTDNRLLWLFAPGLWKKFSFSLPLGKNCGNIRGETIQEELIVYDPS